MTNDPKEKKSSPWGRLVLLAVILGGGYAGWQHYHASAEKPQANATPAKGPVVPVSIATAEKRDFPVYLTGLGTVQAYNTVLVRTRIDGQVDQVAFKEGQIVNKGDLLAEVDPRPYKAALEQVQAKKAQDEANLANAKRDLERSNNLGDFASRQQKDTQAAAVQSQTALVAADQAAIDNAQTQLSNTQITAPITGLTGFRQVDAGNIVNASQATGIVSIAQIEPIAAIFTVPEDQLPAVNAALKAGEPSVTAYSSDGRTKLADGVLELVNNQVDTTSGSVRLKARFDNKEHALWPGLSISTKLLVKTLPGVTTIPNDAVQRGPNGLFTYVVDDANKASAQPITVSLSGEGSSVVDKGVTAGQKVITQGQYRVQPGVEVREVKPADAKVAAGGQGS